MVLVLFMQVTLKDIARRAKCSITTVSRALHGYDDVNEQTRQRIVRIANEMGYQPNAIARQLRSQRTNTIGIIQPAIHYQSDTGYDFFSVLINGASHAAAAHHYDLLIGTQLPGEDEMAAYRRIIGGNRVDGVIVARTRRDDPRLRYLIEANVPFVVAGRTPPDETLNFPYIDADNVAGIHLMVDHMVDLGHRHIGFLNAPDEYAFATYRHQGYLEGLDANGLSYRAGYVVMGEISEAGGAAALNTLLDRAPQITAVIASTDLMAVGAMKALASRGVQVGGAVSVGGFDDLPYAQYVTPSLTTIRQPIYEIGEELTTLLLKIISRKPFDAAGRLIAPTLVVRESSGPI